jgi:sortase B
MYTPGDSEYYLHRAFDRSYSQSGVPFLEGAYTDTCNNYLIYGHNMKNGTMFSSLLSYEKESYWQQHPVVTFDTRDDSGTYDVLGVFYTEIAADRDDVFDYYHYLDLSDPDRYDEYVRKVKENALYDTGIDAAYGDQLLTLSTCSYHVDNGRFVLVARKRSTEE